MDQKLIIDSLGGNSAVARICEVTPQAVSQWRSDGIPKARLMYLRAIYPEVFAASESAAPRLAESRNTAAA